MEQIMTNKQITMDYNEFLLMNDKLDELKKFKECFIGPMGNKKEDLFFDVDMDKLKKYFNVDYLLVKDKKL